MYLIPRNYSNNTNTRIKTRTEKSYQHRWIISIQTNSVKTMNQFQCRKPIQLHHSWCVYAFLIQINTGSLRYVLGIICAQLVKYRHKYITHICILKIPPLPIYLNTYLKYLKIFPCTFADITTYYLDIPYAYLYNWNKQMSGCVVYSWTIILCSSLQRFKEINPLIDCPIFFHSFPSSVLSLLNIYV